MVDDDKVDGDKVDDDNRWTATGCRAEQQELVEQGRPVEPRELAGRRELAEPRELAGRRVPGDHRDPGGRWESGGRCESGGHHERGGHHEHDGRRERGTSWWLAVASVVGLLSGAAVASCGDTSDTGSTESIASTTTTTTTSGTASTSSVPDTSASSTTIDVTPYMPLLLTADAVNEWAATAGTGGGGTAGSTTWKDSNPINENDLNDATGTPCDDTALNPTIIERLRPVTGRQFEPVYEASENPYQHLIEFVTVGEPTRLGMDMQAMMGAFAGCPENPTWDGVPVSITPLALPETFSPGSTMQGPLGDDRYAFTVWAMPGMEVNMDSGSGAGVDVASGVVGSAGVAVAAGVAGGAGMGMGVDAARSTMSTMSAMSAMSAPVGPGTVWYVRTAAIRVAGVMITLSLTEIIEVQVPATGVVPDPVPTVTDEEFIALVERAAELLYQ